MEAQDQANWEKFREKKRNTLTNKEYEMICDMHARYFQHPFWKPCTCSPKTINKWIADLNMYYEAP